MVQITQDCPVFPLPVPLSLVSRIWPCIAHSRWILSTRGTKRPDIFLKNGKRGDSESTDCNTVPEAEETYTWRDCPTPTGAPRMLEPESRRPKKGRSKFIFLVGLRGGLVLGGHREWGWYGLYWPEDREWEADGQSRR